LDDVRILSDAISRRNSMAEEVRAGTTGDGRVEPGYHQRSVHGTVTGFSRAFETRSVPKGLPENLCEGDRYE
jgi:hypothetical protein